MNSKWGEATTLKFVTEYLKHDCLWNMKHPSYKDRQSREMACLRIEDHMGLPGFGQREVRRKIKNIRSTYTLELKKIKRSKNSMDPLYVPQLRWFRMMDEKVKKNIVEVKKSPSDMEENFDDNYEDPMETSIVCEPPPPRHVSKRKRKRSDAGGAVKSKTATETRFVQHQSEPADDMDIPLSKYDNEFEIFGKLVGIQLKSMPIGLALQAQQHIQAYLSNLRIQHLMENTAMRPPSPQLMVSPYGSPSSLPTNSRIKSDDASPDPGENSSSSIHLDEMEAIESQQKYNIE